MTTYTATIQHESLAEEHVPLTATNDRDAIKQTTELAAKHSGARVFCEFFRASDGQRGYINRDGADVTGHPY
jgi:hypothetical protein